VLPQLSLAPDVTAEIQAAVATGKVALVSQQEVTVGPWTGVGYIILDPETGAGAYQISGGANGARAFSIGATAGALIILAFVSIALLFPVVQSLPISTISLVVSELAAITAVIKYLYDQVEPSERPCFWSGFNVVFAFAGLPGLVSGFRLALLFWTIPFLTGSALEAGSTLRCVLGITLPW
jgi:hypothetical protein